MAIPARPESPGADPDRRPPLMTIEEYLAFEDATPIRHELVGGEVFAMTGGSRRHEQIAGNVFGRVGGASRGGPCRRYVANMKLRIGEHVYYPDVTVACGPEPEDPRYEDAPCLLVEVLSRSTRRTDRGEKLAAYQGIAALDTHLVIEQERSTRSTRASRCRRSTRCCGCARRRSRCTVRPSGRGRQARRTASRPSSLAR